MNTKSAIIQEKIKEFRKKFTNPLCSSYEEFKKDIDYRPAFVDFLEKSLSEAYQKGRESVLDEEIMKEEKPSGYKSFGLEPIAIAIRNKVKAELRNKLQGGKA